MAKTQNLSLNPAKISGTCGRLMCCLKYEQDAYEDLLRNAPKAESFVDTPEGRGTVVEVDLLRSRVKVRMEDSPETISTFPNSDIAVLRSGKAKKNDPPIPADLAPISGNGKRAHKEPEFEDTSVVLSSIRLRYSEETIAEQTLPEEAPAEETPEQPKKTGHRRNRRQKNNKPAQTPAAEAAPKAEQAAEGGEKKQNHRRNHYRRNRNKNKAPKQGE